MSDEIPAGLLVLQEEVPENLIGKLPKVSCFECRKKENRGQCGDHKKQRCTICNGWLTTEHTHVDYVGHAETTSKLLEVDALWNWEPLAFNADGLPAFDAEGGLWIRLTVCGVTRLGYGTADNSNGFKARGDIRKEIIGDAIRNASMRFGWALNLWAKTDIHERTLEEEPAQPQQAQQPGPPAPLRFATKDQRTRLVLLYQQKVGIRDRDARLADASRRMGRQIESFLQFTYAEAENAIKVMSGWRDFPPQRDEARYKRLHAQIDSADLDGLGDLESAITEARDAGHITADDWAQLSDFAEARAKIVIADAAGERDWTPSDAEEPEAVGI